MKGSHYGFVVTGPRQRTSTSPTRARAPTPAGSRRDRWEQHGRGPDFTAALGPGGTVIAAGSKRTATGQQGLLVTADPRGTSARLARRGPGGLIPEEAVNGIAVAGGEQIAVGTRTAIPRYGAGTAGGSWALVTSLAQVSADAGLAGLSAVTHGSAGWLAVGPGPLVLTSPDGTAWRPTGSHHAGSGRRGRRPGGQRPARLRDRRQAGRAGRHVPARRLVVARPDPLDQGTRREPGGWLEPGTRRRRGPSGFVSAGSHDGKPAVWTRTDGRAWTTVSIPLAAGASAGVDPAGSGQRDPHDRAGPADHRRRRPAAGRACPPTAA